MSHLTLARWKNRTVSKRKDLCKCGKHKVHESSTRLCLNCLKNKRSIQARYANNLKLECVNHYGGPFCACCGEAHSNLRFLSIDHIKGDGSVHRAEHKCGTGEKFYIWLKRNKWPKGYQVLCSSCNAAKSCNELCPHTDESGYILGKFAGLATG